MFILNLIDRNGK